ncbi:MAG: GNAT family N-acetyltransferase [Clostridiales bacterium]|nr:GNAT family N-acetyltransferase [Clostridiales bacterium]
MNKLYKTGKDFLAENTDLIRNDLLGTIFFEGNATAIGQCDEKNFAIRVEVDGEILIAIHVDGYPLAIYGSERCAEELARVVAENELQFGKAIGYYDLIDRFLTVYESFVGGRHKVNLSMDIMYCDKTVPCDTSEVERAKADDVEEIAHMYAEFLTEALGENATWGEKIDKMSQEINSYALLRVDGEIVSIGMSKDSGYGLKRISNVYTKPEHRNKGYSRKVVTYLTEQVLKSGSLACLHVDQNNPVSNHLYQKIGYKYGKSRYEMEYIK